MGTRANLLAVLPKKLFLELLENGRELLIQEEQKYGSFFLPNLLNCRTPNRLHLKCSKCSHFLQILQNILGADP